MNTWNYLRLYQGIGLSGSRSLRIQTEFFPIPLPSDQIKKTCLWSLPSHFSTNVWRTHPGNIKWEVTVELLVQGRNSPKVNQAPIQQTNRHGRNVFGSSSRLIAMPRERGDRCFCFPQTTKALHSLAILLTQVKLEILQGNPSLCRARPIWLVQELQTNVSKLRCCPKLIWTKQSPESFWGYNGTGLNECHTISYGTAHRFANVSIWHRPTVRENWTSLLY